MFTVIQTFISEREHLTIRLQQSDFIHDFIHIIDPYMIRSLHEALLKFR